MSDLARPDRATPQAEAQPTSTTLPLVPSADTVVFVPAWNEERSLPGVLDELHTGLPDAEVLVIDDGSTDATAAVAAAHGAIVVSFGENRGLRAGIAAATRRRTTAATPTAAGSTRTASIPSTSPCGCSSWSSRTAATSRSAHASRKATGTAPTDTSRPRRGGWDRSAPEGNAHPARSAVPRPDQRMAAVNRSAMPVMARPYASGAPEVEALLRLKQAGLRVEEVAVHMRERSHGESKLQGKKAMKLVLTVVGTLLFFRWSRTGERDDPPGRRPRLLRRRRRRPPPHLRRAASRGRRS